MSGFAPHLAFAIVSIVLGSTLAAAANVFELLDTCATNDPAATRIRSDFEIRRNGAVVGAIPCSEPVSALPIAQYTDELIVVQALRVAYYMDLGRSGHLPWTPLRFYDWMASKIDGINISDTGGPYCCVSLDGKVFAVVHSGDEETRNLSREWRGISRKIALYGHEARHVDGYPHGASCDECPAAPGGCDVDYDEANLTAFGVQWHMHEKWLGGGVYTGFSCHGESETDFLAAHHVSNANEVLRNTFCGVKPAVLAAPAKPGGPCRDGARCGGLPVTLLGTIEDDTITGGPGPDVIKGFGGGDTIKGGGGADLICGGAGNDLLRGGKADDLLRGGAGDDVLRGGDGIDVCDGGPGANDVVCE